ncbi:hypothetical protein WN51_02529 [Melipona quadrifasciata]|uniref:Uncharacterized protein n=1 Tax=Melipona quadrifasciata TaxID=166423 RepID=A0A0M8ZVI8_9HYME|nr:hypothetical protein WN51_02529 [Melipona quadrifasciata]
MDNTEKLGNEMLDEGSDNNFLLQHEQRQSLKARQLLNLPLTCKFEEFVTWVA